VSIAQPRKNYIQQYTHNHRKAQLDYPGVGWTVDDWVVVSVSTLYVITAAKYKKDQSFWGHYSQEAPYVSNALYIALFIFLHNIYG